MGRGSTLPGDRLNLPEKRLRLPARFSRFLGPGTNRRAKIRWYLKEEGSVLIAEVEPGPLVEGPPGHCHGGFIATLLDECMGGSCWLSGHPVLAANLQVSYRRPVPLTSSFIVEAQVQRNSGRRLYCRGSVLSETGTRFAAATGLFLVIPVDRLETEGVNFSAAHDFIQARRSGTAVRAILRNKKDWIGRMHTSKVS